VESTGDPIGAVKWRGEIVSTQATDADRPIWQGVGTGATLDGVSQHMQVASPDTNPTELTWISTTVLDTSVDNTGENRQIISLRDATRPYLQTATREEDRMRGQWGDDSSFGPTMNAVEPLNQTVVTAFRWSSTGTSQSGKIWANSSTDSASSSLTGSFSSNDMFLFCRYGTQNFFKGECREILIYESALTDAQIEDIIDALQDIEASP
jgi:hypothetical protein